MKYSLTDRIAGDFSHKELRIPQSHLKTVCKVGQAGACRYIGLIPSDAQDPAFFCAKHTNARNTIDLAVKNKDMKAYGDNCDGFTLTESV